MSDTDGGYRRGVAWQRGEIVVHREIWRGRPWVASPVVVVEDSPELLVTYLPEKAPFVFPPSADGRPPHPWAGKRHWEGHGVLALRRPGEACSVMHFWEGPERRFAGWYLNLEAPFRRTANGYDTQDLELDVWIRSAKTGASRTRTWSSSASSRAAYG